MVRKGQDLWVSSCNDRSPNCGLCTFWSVLFVLLCGVPCCCQYRRWGKSRLSKSKLLLLSQTRALCHFGISGQIKVDFHCQIQVKIFIWLAKMGVCLMSWNGSLVNLWKQDIWISNFGQIFENKISELANLVNFWKQDIWISKFGKILKTRYLN